MFIHPSQLILVEGTTGEKPSACWSKKICKITGPIYKVYVTYGYLLFLWQNSLLLWQHRWNVVQQMKSFLYARETFTFVSDSDVIIGFPDITFHMIFNVNRLCIWDFPTKRKIWNMYVVSLSTGLKCIDIIRVISYECHSFSDHRTLECLFNNLLGLT